MDVSVQIEVAFREQIKPAPLKKALQTTWQRFNKLNYDTLTVVITDDKTIQRLNHQHRGINAPTDVLSFDNSPDPDFPDLDQGHLGDIIIAFPVAQAQALSAGHTPAEELTLLAVHGCLHLLGFDHDTPANKKKMWTAQRQIMTELGLAHIQPTENEG